MKTNTIPGTYGNAQTPCRVLTYQNRNGSTWYVVEDSSNVNLSPHPLEPGIDVETVQDIDTATSAEPIETEQQLADFIENWHNSLKFNNLLLKKMKRITDKILHTKIDHLNQLTNSPANPYTCHPETGKLTANIGAHFLALGFKGVNVYKLANNAGGITTPLGNHDRPRRQLANDIDQYAAGYRAAAAQR